MPIPNMRLPSHSNLTRLAAIGLTFFVCGAQAQTGAELAAQNNCMVCHHSVLRVMGPSFKAVAQRYAETPAANNLLAQRIVTGGSGAWGGADTRMPANPQLSPAEAQQLAQWVLSQR